MDNEDKIDIASSEVVEEVMIEQQNIEIDVKEEKVEKKKNIKDVKKKPEAKTKSDFTKGRSNTVTAAVEKMKNQEKQSNKIIATGVGATKFNSLLSMFDKSKSNDVQNDQRQSAKVANELDMNKFNIFNQIVKVVGSYKNALNYVLRWQNSIIIKMILNYNIIIKE